MGVLEYITAAHGVLMLAGVLESNEGRVSWFHHGDKAAGHIEKAYRKHWKPVHSRLLVNFENDAKTLPFFFRWAWKRVFLKEKEKKRTRPALR